jgi:hypothetical protein
MAGRASALWCVPLITLGVIAGCGRIGVDLIALNHGLGSTHGRFDAGAEDGGGADAAADSGLDGGAADGGAADGGDVRLAACLADACSACSTAQDATCNGIDDDCDGMIDEDFVARPSSCGVGVCARTGMLRCSGGSQIDSCVAGSASTTIDGPPADGVDDDCDGEVDEDTCDTTPRTFGPGAYPNLVVPSGCNHVSVRLWGGGGASGGKSVAWSAGGSGRGGAGGYASSLVSLSGALVLYVGDGGASGCNAGGANPGSASYSGGRSGSDGADGLAAGGGNGGNAATGGDGGRGCYGGGGGGQGAQEQPWDPPGGKGGGGGAASVFLMNGVPTAIAGGGGGSGGEAGGWWGVSAGGSGGGGCGGDGGVGSQGACGAAGGGGVCLGMLTELGAEGVPYASASLPAGQAAGATNDCGAGGGGYAILTFSR